MFKRTSKPGGALSRSSFVDPIQAEIRRVKEENAFLRTEIRNRTDERLRQRRLKDAEYLEKLRKEHEQLSQKFGRLVVTGSKPPSTRKVKAAAKIADTVNPDVVPTGEGTSAQEELPRKPKKALTEEQIVAKREKNRLRQEKRRIRKAQAVPDAEKPAVNEDNNLNAAV